LQEKAQRVARVARHLQRRRQRLEAVRHSLKKRFRAAVSGSSAAPAAMAAVSMTGGATGGGKPHAAGMMEEHASHVRQLETRRRELIELKAVLAASEKKMLRKWARTRTAMTVAWLLVMAGVVGAGSWFGAGKIFPATVNAYVVLEATSKKSGPVSEIQAQQWTQWHSDLLNNSAFHQTVADRMAERKVETLASADAVKSYLETNLGADATEKGRMRLTLSATNEDEALTNLDVITSTLVTESSRQLGAREGDAWASVPASKKVDGEVKYASIDPVPVKDNRVMYAGITFVGGYALALALAWLIYGKLLGSKRVFDEDNVEEAAASRGRLAAA
jgi:hypothetical protein